MELFQQLLEVNGTYRREYHGPDDETPLQLRENDFTTGGYKTDIIVEIKVRDDMSDLSSPKNFAFFTLDRRWRGIEDAFMAYSKTLNIRYAAVTEDQLRRTGCVDHGAQRWRVVHWIKPQGMQSDWRLLLSPVEQV